MLSHTMKSKFLPTGGASGLRFDLDCAKALLLRGLRFLKACYVDGFRAILSGQYTKRQAALLIAALVPVLLTVAVMTVPLILFPTEGHRAFYHFAHILSTDGASLLPFTISVITATVGMKIPVG